MFLAVVTNIVAIGIGVVLVLGWVAFISELIARRTGRKAAVRYPDDFAWDRCGKTLLSLGLFGGLPDLPQKPVLPRRRQALQDTDRAIQSALQRRSPG